MKIGKPRGTATVIKYFDDKLALTNYFIFKAAGSGNVCLNRFVAKFYEM